MKKHRIGTAHYSLSVCSCVHGESMKAVQGLLDKEQRRVARSGGRKAAENRFQSLSHCRSCGPFSSQTGYSTQKLSKAVHGSSRATSIEHRCRGSLARCNRAKCVLPPIYRPLEAANRPGNRHKLTGMVLCRDEDEIVCPKPKVRGIGPS